MSIQEVVVKDRAILGKEETGRLRRSGHLPGVVYGLGIDASSISMEPKTINTIIRSDQGINSVLNLRLEGTEETRYVMIKDHARHPVSDKLTHIDFMRIDMDKEVKATIPLRFEGSPEGVKLGGLLTITRHDVEIECLPGKLLGAIVVDVSDLGLEQKLCIGDLPQHEGVRYVLGPTRTVAVVHASRIEAEEDETAAVEGAAPAEAPTPAA